MAPGEPPRPFRHHPFYCEENVWHLCRDLDLGDRPRSAVFLGNPAGGFVMWHQRAARRPGAPIAWDYHVILLAEAPWEVWDLDTTLGFPVPAPEYLRRSFHPALPDAYQPRFRIVEASAFVGAFASDRAHMILRNGRWQAPPPPWPLIGRPGEPSNLARFLDMEAPFLGRVLTLGELRREVGVGGDR